ncbi:MAG: hypothetical protein LC769_05675 [Chloroflexi bacterium]|nr:hypothetical protein [Chloroflexota bacterium]
MCSTTPKHKQRQG